MAREKTNKFAELDGERPSKNFSVPAGYRLQRIRETDKEKQRSERLNILVNGKSKAGLSELAKETGQSMNEIVNTLIDNHLKLKGKL